MPDPPTPPFCGSPKVEAVRVDSHCRVVCHGCLASSGNAMTAEKGAGVAESEGGGEEGVTRRSRHSPSQVRSPHIQQPLRLSRRIGVWELLNNVPEYLLCRVLAVLGEELVGRRNTRLRGQLVLLLGGF